MQKPLSVLTALAVVATAASPVATMAQAERIKAGTLTCDISGGIGLIITSHKEVSCIFTPSQPGPHEVYVGAINKFGLDLGATAGGEMVWAVYAPTTRRFGALAGNYGGASAEATVGAGLGANVLVGGSGSNHCSAAAFSAGAGGPQRSGGRLHDHVIGFGDADAEFVDGHRLDIVAVGLDHGHRQAGECARRKCSSTSR